MAQHHPDQNITFRSRFGIALTLVVWAISIAGIVSAVLGGVGLVPIILLASLAWFVWLAFWRPSVVTDPDGVLFRNLVRDVRIPYEAIEDVDTRFALTVEADGRTWSAWGAPAPSGAASLRTKRPHESTRDLPASIRQTGAARSGDLVTSASGAPATVIRRELERRAEEGLPSGDGHVQVTTRMPLVATSAVLLVASIAAIVVGSL